MMVRAFILICLMATPILAERLPRHVKTPESCKVVNVTGERDGKVYKLSCSRSLSKRMRGWVFFDKDWSKDKRYRTRVWYSRRDSWRMEEKSYCKIRTCRAFSITIYKIFSCQYLSDKNPFL